MKKIALWILVFLLCSVQGTTFGESGLVEDVLRVKLERFEASGGTASMTLRFESRASHLLRVCLIEPSFNQAPAAFLNGWNTDVITIEANASSEIDISIFSDRKDALPEEVSVRFAAEGMISSPMVIRREGDGVAVTEAVFGLASGEPPLMSDQPVAGEARESERRTLSDRLSADEKARFVDGRAVICLRETEEGEDRFVCFCTVPVIVNDDGSVYADYSGYAVTVSGASDFPLSAVEELQDGLRRFLVSRIVLTGNAAFYADLSFEVCRAEDGSLSLGEYSIRSEELGGVYHSVPLSLFAQFSSADAVLRLAERDGNVEAQVVNDRFISVALEQPLAVEVKPSTELGEVYAYFEYYFSDNRSVARPPFPL